jgi:type III secretory pathway component EscR
MSEPRKTIKPILKEATEDENLPKLQIEIQDDPKNLAENGLSPEEHYLQRKMEVTKRDHEEFVAYLEEKRSREEQKRAQQSEPVQVAPAPADIAGAAPGEVS